MNEKIVPEPIAQYHDLATFQCGVPTLDDWLKRRARTNDASGASRTFVLADNDRVIGYYCLAAGAIATFEAPSRLRRNMPDPIPVAILGRLAICQASQGTGFGEILLRDAVIRSKEAAKVIGIAGLLVHALDDNAKGFYVQYGFVEAPGHPMTLVLSFKKQS